MFSWVDDNGDKRVKSAIGLQTGTSSSIPIVIYFSIRQLLCNTSATTIIRIHPRSLCPYFFFYLPHDKVYIFSWSTKYFAHVARCIRFMRIYTTFSDYLHFIMRTLRIAFLRKELGFSAHLCLRVENR